MINYTKAKFRTIFAPIGATGVTAGLLVMMYSLIAYDEVVPTEGPEVFPIPDIVQEEPPIPEDQRITPEKYQSQTSPHPGPNMNTAQKMKALFLASYLLQWIWKAI